MNYIKIFTDKDLIALEKQTNIFLKNNKAQQLIDVKIFVDISGLYCAMVTMAIPE